MNFSGNFIHIGDIDIEELRSLVAQLSDEQWTSLSIRQQRYEVHKHTQTIGLVYDPDFRHTHPTRLPPLKMFDNALKPVLWMIADHFEQSPAGRALVTENGLGYFIRATLVRLEGGHGIAAHRDMNFSLTHSHRLHLPLITNDDVLFTVGKETVNLPAGSVYEINNRRVHSVENNGQEARVHLILDFVLPGEKCCCGEKHHPDTRCSPRACLETVRGTVACDCHPEA